MKKRDLSEAAGFVTSFNEKLNQEYLNISENIRYIFTESEWNENQLSLFHFC